MRLAGKDLFLRQWKDSDATALVEMCNDKEIPKFTHVRFPYRISDARKFIRESKLKRMVRLAYDFAVVLKDSGKIIGSMSFVKVDWRDKVGGAGYYIHRDFRKKGYASEALQLLLGFGFGKLKLHRIEMECSTLNKASRRVIEKTGARFEGIKRERCLSGNGKRHSTRLYSILAREFKGRK